MVDRQRVALHEASHAVIARKLSVPKCGGASIVLPNAHAKFSCDHGAASVVALMAGRAAELAVLGNFDAVGSSVDHERWTRRLERCGYTEEALWRRTAALVREHNGLIMWLAQHLAYAQTLDGRSIDDIVARG